ncbi:hypothetical protein XENOCAPTIV_019420 [Xenoophorus captivus]|uniref:Uncharacterized protein n=1 Tax=Xenoophorus captivus TaxID=1517983 RepID=A0ABV0S7Y5_9TELE
MPETNIKQGSMGCRRRHGTEENGNPFLTREMEVDRAKQILRITSRTHWRHLGLFAVLTAFAFLEKIYQYCCTEGVLNILVWHHEAVGDSLSICVLFIKLRISSNRQSLTTHWRYRQLT